MSYEYLPSLIVLGFLLCKTLIGRGGERRVNLKKKTFPVYDAQIFKFVIHVFCETA